MRANNFWGGFLQGVGQGLEQQHRRKQQEEELKLKQDLAKRQVSLQDILEKKAQREAEQHETGKTARATLKQAILGRQSWVGSDPRRCRKQRSIRSFKNAPRETSR